MKKEIEFKPTWYNILLVITVFILVNMLTAWILQSIMAWVFSINVSFLVAFIGAVVADIGLMIINSKNKTSDK